MEHLLKVRLSSTTQKLLTTKETPPQARLSADQNQTFATAAQLKWSSLKKRAFLDAGDVCTLLISPLDPSTTCT